LREDSGGLFNIMQEGDVQIKGYPVRCRSMWLWCSARNPEDYTARGKIITPLKIASGRSPGRTTCQVEEGMAITAQESWTQRDGYKLHLPSMYRKSSSEWRL